MRTGEVRMELNCVWDRSGLGIPMVKSVVLDKAAPGWETSLAVAAESSHVVVRDRVG